MAHHSVIKLIGYMLAELAGALPSAVPGRAPQGKVAKLPAAKLPEKAPKHAV